MGLGTSNCAIISSPLRALGKGPRVSLTRWGEFTGAETLAGLTHVLGRAGTGPFWGTQFLFIIHHVLFLLSEKKCSHSSLDFGQQVSLPLSGFGMKCVHACVIFYQNMMELL